MPRSRTFRLTAQQQAIVDHDSGPALVYAVAGAGKTTAMVQRIARLVQDGICSPRQILATSFNRDANRQISSALGQWSFGTDVQVKTLHAVGYSIVQLAIKRGYLPDANLSAAARNPAAIERRLLEATLASARAERLPYVSQMEAIDGEDFLNFVRICKGGLCFPDLRSLRLSRRRRRVAQRAEAPAGKAYYLDLYRRYEMIRQAERLLTFDDMLMTGWEMLARHEDLLATVQRRYQSVLVDEYQDVNRAQAEMLDLITESHRNYMVIGDDDQTIYEWRGANPSHLRRFQQRYRRAATYFMTENFRGRASQIVLANQIMQHDDQRRRKIMQVVRGFGGESRLERYENEIEVARAVANRIRSLRGEAVPLSDMAILLRVNAQAALISDMLGMAGIDSRLVEDEPAAGSAGATGRAHGDRVTITTIHRAKGLEWPVVFVPGCNAGLIPLAKSGNLSEERRLLYVAVTRAGERLFLYATNDRPLSPFLEQISCSTVLDATAAIEQALSLRPDKWALDDFVAVGINAKRLYLTGYFVDHWRAPAARRRLIAEAVLRFYATLRRQNLFRKLGLKREDTALWQRIAGRAVDETPLDRPDIDAALHRL